MKKRITAIVVTWNSSKLIRKLAETVKEIEPLCNIVISDNASTDSTVETVSELIPGAGIVRNSRNGGFGFGNNRGIESCDDSEYVLFLNSDASISIQSLEKLLSTLESDPTAAGVQPLVRLWDWPLVTLSAGAAMTEYGRGYDLDFMHFQPFPDDKTKEVPCVTAALSLFRTEALKKAGGFDEKIFMYFEDLDLCLRLRGLGYRFLLEPGATGMHMAGASSSRKIAEKWELQSSAFITRRYLSGRSCRLPKYWRKAELRTRIYSLIKGRNWLWRYPALLKARKMDMDHVSLPGDFIMRLLAPRPLRMPYQRPRNSSGKRFPGTDVKLGPGWFDLKTESCGFGCMEVPDVRGLLSLTIRSCNISGSVALWPENGYPSRIFLSKGKNGKIAVEVSESAGRFYLVPDRREQKIELENVTFVSR